MLYLQNFEKRLATIEESLLDTLPKELQRTLITIRRELLVFHAYYQQLLDMCEILSEDENHFLPRNAPVSFRALETAWTVCTTTPDAAGVRPADPRDAAGADRPASERYDADSDGRLDDLFPLSLIAGWYGMNFTHMPELSAPYAYFILIGVCILIVAVEIWYFKKKGWF